MWYKRFSWRDNPFSLTPRDRIVGLHRERKLLIDRINARQILFLAGETGCGKTSMLLWLCRTLSSASKNLTPLIINGIKIDSKQQFIDTLRKHRKILDRVFLRNYPKNMVLLMDEAQHFSQSVLELVRVLWDNKSAYAIIFASSETSPQNMTIHLKDRISRIVRIPPLRRGDLVEMLKERMGKNNPFDLDALISIVDGSTRVPRRVLDWATEVCIWAAENSISNINSKVVQDWAEEVKIKRVTKEEQIPEQEVTSVTKGTEQPPSLSEMQQKIYQAILRGADTAPSISKTLNVENDIVRVQLRRMIKKGVIEQTERRRPKKYAVFSRV